MLNIHTRVLDAPGGHLSGFPQDVAHPAGAGGVGSGANGTGQGGIKDNTHELN